MYHTATFAPIDKPLWMLCDEQDVISVQVQETGDLTITAYYQVDWIDKDCEPELTRLGIIIEGEPGFGVEVRNDEAIRIMLSRYQRLQINADAMQAADDNGPPSSWDYSTGREDAE